MLDSALDSAYYKTRLTFAKTSLAAELDDALMGGSDRLEGDAGERYALIETLLDRLLSPLALDSAIAFEEIDRDCNPETAAKVRAIALEGQETIKSLMEEANQASVRERHEEGIRAWGRSHLCDGRGFDQEEIWFPSWIE